MFTCVAFATDIKLSMLVLRKPLKPVQQELEVLRSCHGSHITLKCCENDRCEVVSPTYGVHQTVLEHVRTECCSPVAESPVRNAAELLEYEKPTPAGDSRNRRFATTGKEKNRVAHFPACTCNRQTWHAQTVDTFIPGVVIAVQGPSI